jgi:hypothetical protein
LKEGQLGEIANRRDAAEIEPELAGFLLDVERPEAHSSTIHHEGTFVPS